MKKVIFICLSSFLLFGCTKNYEKELQEVGKNYFNDYIVNKVDGLDKIEITLGELRMIRKLNLDSVNKCKDDTKIIMTIKNNKIISYDIDQHCD